MDMSKRLRPAPPSSTACHCYRWEIGSKGEYAGLAQYFDPDSRHTGEHSIPISRSKQPLTGRTEIPFHTSCRPSVSLLGAAIDSAVEISVREHYHACFRISTPQSEYKREYIRKDFSNHLRYCRYFREIWDPTIGYGYHFRPPPECESIVQ